MEDDRKELEAEKFHYLLCFGNRTMYTIQTIGGVSRCISVNMLNEYQTRPTLNLYLTCVAGVNREREGEQERGRKMGDWTSIFLLRSRSPSPSLFMPATQAIDTRLTLDRYSVDTRLISQ